jgi:hypothetical protein
MDILFNNFDILSVDWISTDIFVFWSKLNSFHFLLSFLIFNFNILVTFERFFFYKKKWLLLNLNL